MLSEVFLIFLSHPETNIDLDSLVRSQLLSCISLLHNLSPRKCY
jgi:hypothetical protein